MKIKTFKIKLAKIMASNLAIILLCGNFYFVPKALAGVFLNDPGYTENPLDIDKQWALPKVGFPTAWQKSVGSKSVIIAVLDTGVDQTHEDLKAINYIAGYDFVHNQGINPLTNSDDNGHGTLVAGVIGATANNGYGVVGANWQISIMPIKTLDSTGKGDVSVLSQAIVWATDHGAQIINLSLGGVGQQHDTTLSTAIAYAFNKGVVIVAAAGNDKNQTGENLDLNPVYPICDDNNSNMVIGVAAVDQNDIKADFSNYGKNCIDVSAPGKRILSTINVEPVTKRNVSNAYAYVSGTSMAVPLVVAQAALIKSVYPYATNVEIRDRIIASADKIDSLNLSQCGGASCQGMLGSGRINVVKSLEPDLLPNFSEGELVKLIDGSGATYQISGGQKRLVSAFVFNQQFLNSTVRQVYVKDLASLPEGPYVTPKDGTLVKLNNDQTVYYISSGKKLPVTFTIFNQRQLNFTDIKTVSYDELNSWTTGSFLPPKEGTVLKTVKNKTVYWVVGQVLHPVNYKYYLERGLNTFRVELFPDNDIKGFSLGEPYIK